MLLKALLGFRESLEPLIKINHIFLTLQRVKNGFNTSLVSLLKFKSNAFPLSSTDLSKLKFRILGIKIQGGIIHSLLIKSFSFSKPYSKV